MSEKEEMAIMNGFICVISLVLFGSVNSVVSDKSVVQKTKFLKKNSLLLVEYCDAHFTERFSALLVTKGKQS